ncbi:MAG: hypothetical protein P8N43_06735, partial [Alphaproteobacteria bacterium]|nr:hypothetical protein [Alphaproteobacteria bacterium]
MRILARVIIVLVTFLHVLAPALYLARDTLASVWVSWIAQEKLGLSGLGSLEFHIDAVTSDHLKITNLTTGDGTITVGAVEATFDLSRLSEGHIRSLTVTNLSIRGRYEDGRLDLGPLNALFDRPDGEDPKGDLPSPPFDVVTLKGTHVLLMAPQGTVDVGLDITARTRPDGTMRATGDLHAALVGAFEADG